MNTSDKYFLSVDAKNAIRTNELGVRRGSLSLFVSAVVKTKMGGMTFTDAADYMFASRNKEFDALKRWNRATDADLDMHALITDTFLAIVCGIEEGKQDMDVTFESAMNELSAK